MNGFAARRRAGVHSVRSRPGALTIQEAAGILGISRTYVVRLVNDAKIPAHLVGTPSVAESGRRVGVQGAPGRGDTGSGVGGRDGIDAGEPGRWSETILEGLFEVRRRGGEEDVGTELVGRGHRLACQQVERAPLPQPADGRAEVPAR